MHLLDLFYIYSTELVCDKNVMSFTTEPEAIQIRGTTYDLIFWSLIVTSIVNKQAKIAFYNIHDFIYYFHVKNMILICFTGVS